MRSPIESLLIRSVDLDTLIDLIATETVKRLTPVIESTRQRGLLSRNEMAEFLGISLPKLDDMIRRNEIPSIMLGSRRMFDADVVLACLRGGDDHA